MGAAQGERHAEECEGPRRQVNLPAFRIAQHPVTNSEFEAFVSATDYRTQAEIVGDSFVFQGLLSAAARRKVRSIPAETPWWYPTEGANWGQPEGPGSDLADRKDHPVVHVSWHDAHAFARWARACLPSEAMWECAARGGVEGQSFPWGDELEPEGRHMANVWQGRFPGLDRAEDGFAGTSPVASFPANGYGLFDVIGNVWEWCEDWFDPGYHSNTSDTDPLCSAPTGQRALRGGSFLCHASYCARYRSAARSCNRPDATASNIGFRIAERSLR